MRRYATGHLAACHHIGTTPPYPVKVH